MAPPRRGGRFILQGQRGGDVYEGVENPNGAMAAFKRGTSASMSAPPDMGLLTQQAEAHRTAYERQSEAAAKASDESKDMMSPGWRPGTSEEERVRSQNAMARMNAAGNPWDLWFQTLQNQGVDGLQGGPSPEGSDQLRGFGPDQIVRRKGFSQYPVSQWQDESTITRSRRQRPMPESQDEFYARTRPAMRSLTQGR